MGNLRDRNHQNPKLRVNMDEYWDFTVSHDAIDCYQINGSGLCNDDLISYIDMTDESCYDGDSWLFSKQDYSWVDGYAVEHDMANIGYTGVDNGLIRYRRDRINNKTFFDLFTGSKYHIDDDDIRLKLHAVSGSTALYDYPLHVENGSVELNGGFYQGFFRTECGKYNVLPHKIDSAWSFEVTLKKCDLKPSSKKTLNDKYPENKGIFFYIGTRAENKWVYLYEKDDECYTLSPDNYVEDAHIDKEGYIINNFFDLSSVYDVPYQFPNDEDIYGNVHSKILKPCILHEPYVPEYHVKSIITQCGCKRKYWKVPVYPSDVKEEEKSEIEPDDYVEIPTISTCGSMSPDNYVDESGIDPIVEEIIDAYNRIDCDYVADEIDISYFDYQTDNGMSISGVNQYYFYTDNKFMLFDRTKDGYKVNNWVEGTKMMYYGTKNKFKGNLFMLMNRTKTGYTINDIQELIDRANNQYDSLYKDIIYNAFALRITDDGEIGYRYIVPDCTGEEDYLIQEGYSDKGVIPDCEWTTVHVRIERQGKLMKLLFYVNGKLVYITDTMPMLNLRKLDEINEKQEGVPFNISLGGGTQGLAETVQRNYMLDPSRVYPLEKHFAGTFIGYLKSFRFYNGWLSYDCISNNYEIERLVS